MINANVYSIRLHISPTFQSSGIESGHVLETWIEDTAALRKDRKEQSQIRKMRKIREKKERMQQGNLLNMDLESVNHFSRRFKNILVRKFNQNKK